MAPVTKKKVAPKSPPETAPVLTPEQVRQLLREGEAVRRDLEARIDRMRKVSPRDAAARAR